MPYTAAHKDPQAVKDFPLDWTEELGTDTIATSTWTVPTGITQNSASNTTTTTTIWLSGGTGGQDYQLLNRITTVGGRTHDWILVVRVGQFSVIPTGPPYAAITEHVSYTPMAEGEEAFKVEMVALDASDIVQRIAPSPPKVSSTLLEAMDASQDTLTIVRPLPDPFPASGELLIGSEVVGYSERKENAPATLIGLRRGLYTTTPAAHNAADPVTEVGYALRARRAELAVFEWLFSTRGWRPSRSGVLGSEAYSIGDEVYQIVRSVMGAYYGRKGGAVRGTVAMTNFPRRTKTPYDWQMGWYDV